MIRYAQPVGTPAFAEFGVTTNFSFLRGGSHPEELVAEAMNLGLTALGVADRNTLAGVVRGHVYRREHKDRAPGFRYAVGARLVFDDGAPDLLAYPQDRAAYGRLAQLLTLGNRRAHKGDCILRFDDVAEWAEGLQFIVMEETTRDAARPARRAAHLIALYAARLAKAAPGRVWLAARQAYGGHVSASTAPCRPRAMKLQGNRVPIEVAAFPLPTCRLRPLLEAPTRPTRRPSGTRAAGCCPGARSSLNEAGPEKRLGSIVQNLGW